MLVKNALVVAVGGFLAKLLGAVYRIPLGNLLGGYGLGLYQMVFPVYAMLLTLSGASVPSALSKLIAESGEEEGEKLVRAAQSLRVFGAVFSLAVGIFSYPLARLQGNAGARYAYLFLAPSVFFVTAFSVYRGYFQGKGNMLPTVLSQMVEQTAKLLFGLLFASALLPNVPLAAGGACLGVTVSEALAYLYLRAKYRKGRGRKILTFAVGEKRALFRRVLKHVFPMTMIGILPPLTGVIIGFFTIPLLSKTTPFATRQYGLFFGGVTAVTAMPVALCYGVAVALIPLISKRQKSEENGTSFPIGKRAETTAYLYTLLLALPASLATYLFRKEIIAVLFPALTVGEQLLGARLLGVSSLSILLVSVGQTASAVLIGSGRAVRSAKNYAVGCAVNLLCSFFLLYRGYGIISLTISQILGDSIATFLNLLYTKKANAQNKEKFLIFPLALLTFLSGAVGQRAGMGGPLLRIFSGGGVMLTVYLAGLSVALFFVRIRKRRS
ncbi:MAG: oligosaccharide flippase family protein [Clostridia bacterium]|nr:oligosaccharide flippase family protein [Clostridia bacterium]